MFELGCHLERCWLVSQPGGIVGRNLQRYSCVVMNWLGRLRAVPLPSAGWHVRCTAIYRRNVFIG